jgi:hypothetical protein
MIRHKHLFVGAIAEDTGELFCAAASILRLMFTPMRGNSKVKRKKPYNTSRGACAREVRTTGENCYAQARGSAGRHAARSTGRVQTTMDGRPPGRVAEYHSSQ